MSEHFISKPISRKILPSKSMILKSCPIIENDRTRKISMKRRLNGLFLSMIPIFFMCQGLGAEGGLHQIAQEILQKCTCRFEHPQIIKDKKMSHSLLQATLFCNCGVLDTKMAVVCAVQGEKRPTPKECARDESISWEKAQDGSPSNFELKQENANGMGTVH